MLTSPDVSCSVATHLENLENLEKLGNLRVVREKSGKCVLACGQLLHVLFLTQNMHERSSLLGKVVHIEHSCHSYDRIYEYCSEK